MIIISANLLRIIPPNSQEIKNTIEVIFQLIIIKIIKIITIGIQERFRRDKKKLLLYSGALAPAGSFPAEPAEIKTPIDKRQRAINKA